MCSKAGECQLNLVHAIGIGKRDLRIPVRFQTGHNWLNRHMSVMRSRENPKCPPCDEEDETSLHLLAKCPAIIAHRNALLGTF